MDATKLPLEVQLAFEIMPCNAMRTAQEPIPTPHPCSYFRKWGAYHSYDYAKPGVPPDRNLIQVSDYVGKAPVVPEMLSGCRKAPILTVGINPNLPGWWPAKRNSLSPLFDDYRQFAHYFRYRSVAKLELPEADYEHFGGGAGDNPLNAFTLNVPTGANGERTIAVELQNQDMYLGYNDLLKGLADNMHWTDHQLTVGEDIAYGNMVACPSAKWITSAPAPTPDNPPMPPMTLAERDGIVAECFHKRRYFVRQLFQSLPAVLMIFSQNTANAFINELQSRFVEGNPQPNEPLANLMARRFRLRYGTLPDGTDLLARIIFAPHITGSPAEFAAARDKIVGQLTEEATAGNLRFNSATKHLQRSRGACVFCTMLEIGPCDYENELQPISLQATLTADSAVPDLQAERTAYEALMQSPLTPQPSIAQKWADTDDPPDATPLSHASAQ